MNPNFFFYDLETSGFNPREARIMQFAGLRTNMELEPIGEPFDYLIKMTEDILPDPDAVLLTGITPQKTIAEGLSEVEFLKIFHEQIALAGTIFVGYNSIRFDDEFLRYLHYRNFYDPYEWHWRDKRSKWDILDALRMMRALRPEGMNWPVDSKGKPTNRLELLASLNNLVHDNAHEALSDVKASLALAQLFCKLQPKLFGFLLKARDKNEVAKIVLADAPFVYTSGKYASEYEKTTVAGVVTENPKRDGKILVFDLRCDPTEFVDFTPEELVEAWRWRKDDSGIRLPVKTLRFNRAPAVAPLSVLDELSEKRINLTKSLALDHFEKLQTVKSRLAPKILAALEIMDKRQQTQLLGDESEVDAQLYDGFFEESDKNLMSVVRSASGQELTTLGANFKDNRLNTLLPLYKARSYPRTISDQDRNSWERFRERRLLGGGNQSRMSRYFARISELEAKDNLTKEQSYLLQELQLYAQSIMPGDIA